MFMSMGEPLLNFKELTKAIDYLAEAYPKAKLLISTSAPRVDYGPVKELSQKYPNVGLQFSVHKTTDEERDQLIPFKAKLNLSEISEAGYEWAMATGRRPYFNYVVGDTNNREEDAERLNSLFSPAIWEATLSVVCERNDGLPATNDYQRQLASDFSQKLLSRGFSTRVFDPAGQDDIGGGCGQLPHAQRWFSQHADKTKKTVGYGLPMVHTPRIAA
jgi:23S rRNA (adenine2503-C2)-methyltransferase